METIELSHDTAQRIRAMAEAEGVTVEAYLSAIAAGGSEPQNGMSLAEIDQILDELAAGDNLPPLPADFSREDIYRDHD
jgi:hypothetical protein